MTTRGSKPDLARVPDTDLDGLSAIGQVPQHAVER